MKTNLLLSLITGSLMILVQPSAINAQGWYSLNSGITSDLMGVHFPTLETGYAVGFKILKTTDAGISWTDKTPVTTSYFNAVYFTNANTGYVVGGTGDIIKTTDGGTSWTTLTNIYEGDLRSVFFTDDNTGYVVGFNWGTGIGLIYKTNDGGQTWINQSLPGIQVQHLYDVVFLNSDTGFTTGGQGTIVKTTDGGTTWTIHNIDWKYDIDAISFPSPDTGYGVGWNQNATTGAMFKSTDGGLTWTDISPANLSSLMRDVWFSDVNTGYAVGDHTRILKTTDGGINWVDQYTNFPDSSKALYSLHFTGPDTGYAVGPSGTIIKTTNGGVGIALLNGPGLEIRFWPNPVNSTLHFSNIPASRIILLEILDLYGRVFDRINRAENMCTIDVSDLSKGMYMIRLTTDQSVYSHKFCKD